MLADNLIKFIVRIKDALRWRSQNAGSAFQSSFSQARLWLRWHTARRFRKHALPNRLVISLTSYTPRFGTLSLTLRSLLCQTVQPDDVILWVGPGDFARLPPNVTDLTAHGLKILQTPDIGPYTKIIPALDCVSDAFIATADDDIYYWPSWLEELVKGRDNSPYSVTCHRAHRITAGADGAYKAYNEWKLDTPLRGKAPDLFPTGVGGVLYPPGILSHTNEDRQAALSLCPRADDLWLYWIGRRNGAVYKTVARPRRLVQWVGSQGTALWAGNVMQGGNDRQSKALAAQYGYPAIDK